MMTRTIAGFVVFGAVVWAQAPIQFDVATIKPVEAIIAGAGQRINFGVHVDGSQFNASSMTVRDLLAAANKMRIYQVEGPDWITSDRFDMNAKIPEGVALENDNLMKMLDALLVERFAIKSHRVQKEFPVYALVFN